MDQYDSISNRLHDTKSFQDNRDISTTYLGKENITREDEFLPELSFPINVKSHTEGKIVGGNKLDMLLDTGASKIIHVQSILYEEPPNYTLFLDIKPTSRTYRWAMDTRLPHFL